MSADMDRTGSSWYQWQPTDSGFPEQVLAVIDDQRCSAAAIRHAVPIAARGRGVLTIVLVRPRTPTLLALSPAVVYLPHDELESESFASAAAVVAPSGISWDFRVSDAGQLVDDGAHPRLSILVVAVNHWEGRIARVARRLRLARRQVESVCRESTPLLTVNCGHNCSRYRRSWRSPDW